MVWRAIEKYRHAMGSMLTHYLYRSYDEELQKMSLGEMRPLDDFGWSYNRGSVLGGYSPDIWLSNEPGLERQCAVKYWGMSKGDPSSGWVSTLEFELGIEYLERHGPGHVRELVLDLAEDLPFVSGHAGLYLDVIFGADRREPGPIEKAVHGWLFRYPGLEFDTYGDKWAASLIRADVRAVSWLTFLGQPVLGHLGGAQGLRARLSSPGTTVQEMEGDRVVVTLGQWPEAGDLQRGDALPAYRELAKVLEPYLLLSEEQWPHRPFESGEELVRWRRRFLD